MQIGVIGGRRKSVGTKAPLSLRCTVDVFTSCLVSLQNKMFIYRGKEYEWLEDFSLKLLSQFPNAVRMTSTAPPGENISSSPSQRILV